MTVTPKSGEMEYLRKSQDDRAQIVVLFLV